MESCACKRVGVEDGFNEKHCDVPARHDGDNKDNPIVHKPLTVDATDGESMVALWVATLVVGAADGVCGGADAFDDETGCTKGYSVRHHKKTGDILFRKDDRVTGLLSSGRRSRSDLRV